MARIKTQIPEKPALGEMTDTQKIAALEEQNTELRQIVDYYEKDSFYSLYFAINRKNNEMASVITKSKLSLEDNSVKNYQAAIKGMPDTFLETEKLRNQYLKIPADAALEIEAKGTPLIEQRAEKKADGGI